MGNVESPAGLSSRVSGQHLSRKLTSRPLRLSSTEAAAPSSSPSIPRSLAPGGLEAGGAADAAEEFGVDPHWTQRVAMTMRPESDLDLDDPTADTWEADAVAQEGGEEGRLPRTAEGGGFMKRRSKSADMWREDSLELSLSDLSQERTASTEEMVAGGQEQEQGPGLPGSTGAAERASSLDHLCCRREAGCHGDGEDGLMSPSEEDGGGYGAFTLPCRRSHRLSEGLSQPGATAPPLLPVFLGRRAQTTQDICGALGEGSEFGDSGIDGVAAEPDADGELLSRRCKAMSASFSVHSATESLLFNGSDSGSSSGGGEGKALDSRPWVGGACPSCACSGAAADTHPVCFLCSQPLKARDSGEEAGSAASEERSSGTFSGPYPPAEASSGCTQGTVRKAGALAVKNSLVHKKNKKVEPASKRKWKHYWVSLRGCTLFLHESDGRSAMDHDCEAKHALWVEHSIVQAVPEHPKKDFVFCLSNSAGDAFLFQTSGQTELENWMTAIHSACAGALARQHHRDDPVRLLRTEIRKLEQRIDMDEKMKKMGDMQLSTVTDAKKRKAILEQIFLWEQNLERFHVDLFRCRCYLASLQGGEPPNPKRLLACASRPTKVAMGRLGIFSVSSFHALVAARSESDVKRRRQAMPRTLSTRRSRFSSLWGLDTAAKRKSKRHPALSQVLADGAEPPKARSEQTRHDALSEGSVSSCNRRVQEQARGPTLARGRSGQGTGWETGQNPGPCGHAPTQLRTRSDSGEAFAEHNTVFGTETVFFQKRQSASGGGVPQQTWVPQHLTPSWVCLPNNQPVLAIVQPGETALELLASICQTHRIDPCCHYLRLKVWLENQVLLYVPKLEEEVSELLYKEIEICPKATKVLHFDKAESSTVGYGFSVAVLDEEGTQQLHVTEVKAGGLASAKGMKAGDEILLLNGKAASQLQMEDVRSAFVRPALSLSLSTLPRLDPMVLCSLPPRRCDQNASVDILSLSQEDILDEVSGLTVEERLEDGGQQSGTGPEAQNTEQVSAFCQGLRHMGSLERPMTSSSSSSSSSSSLTPSPVSALPPSSGGATPRQLSHADKLRKVISELVQTEETYVKDLRYLMECYLTPLQAHSFLTQDELDDLFGNLGEMVDFQVEFLRTLEDGLRLVPELERLERVEQFKKVLFSLGGSFLYYADRFKLYSAFCASHTKVPKVLAKARSDPHFKAFLAERNPRQQHSSSLESYLIKPIQRVLKYPLLLRELHGLTDPDSEEHYHLDVAMKAMNKVASHINEMQKLHEEYGAVFDLLIGEQTSAKKEVSGPHVPAHRRWLRPHLSPAPQVADLSMGDLLLHATVGWINAPPALLKGKKDPQLAAFVFKTAVVFVHKDPAKPRKKLGASHRASVSEDKDPVRFRHMIATDSLQVRALASCEGSGACEVVHSRSEAEGRPERSFQLCCSSPDSRKDLLKALHSILREKQRRQLLKTQALPPSQQYVPFGGRRLCALKGPPPAAHRAASAPRRRLVRKRFTVDTDLVFHGDNNNGPRPPGEDTQRWVEEPRDLGPCHEACGATQVKETDILSDGDEYCASVRAAGLEARMRGPGVSGQTRREAPDPPSLQLAPLKPCGAEGAAGEVWVQRDDVF
ncbi:rho guanine nucleotide exchange factor TIAM1 [Synchiropus picturatus]